MPNNQQPSFLTTLLLTPHPSHPRPGPKRTTPPAPGRGNTSPVFGPVPLALWLQAGGTGPPPQWSDFLSRTRRRIESTRLPREAAEAWDREKEAAYKAVEDAWGKRKGRPPRRELVRWYVQQLREKDGAGGRAAEQQAEETRTAGLAGGGDGAVAGGDDQGGGGEDAGAGSDAGVGQGGDGGGDAEGHDNGADGGDGAGDETGAGNAEGEANDGGAASAGGDGAGQA